MSRSALPLLLLLLLLPQRSQCNFSTYSASSWAAAARRFRMLCECRMTKRNKHNDMFVCGWASMTAQGVPEILESQTEFLIAVLRSLESKERLVDQRFISIRKPAPFVTMTQVKKYEWEERDQEKEGEVIASKTTAVRKAPDAAMVNPGWASGAELAMQGNWGRVFPTTAQASACVSATAVAAICSPGLHHDDNHPGLSGPPRLHPHMPADGNNRRCSLLS
ncbi:hypothetical protein B0H66DRAFT_588537 [Apodospora peruviana]|uniref:Uncharacterized protein n=1 Tax=Apodospora peruviana TaxID=516989 RepID=A0AAE0IIY6_9PEZI|nr:hypothetical protein B0H66DRAFT_588537 [Apodospora peruviana]